MSSSTEGVDRRSARPLALAYASGAFGLAMTAQVTFLVPLRARELGASFDIIGLLIGSGALAAALSSVSCGAVIDRLGPKRTFILGAAGTAVLSLLFVLVTSYWWFFLLQPVLGIARNLGWVASQGYITSVGTPQERPKLAGRFSFFSSVGQMAGPVLVGGAAQLYGIRSALEIIALRGIQVALLLTFARLWVGHIYSTFLPVYLVETGFEPGVVGTVMATSGLVAALMAPTTGFWTRYLS